MNPISCIVLSICFLAMPNAARANLHMRSQQSSGIKAKVNAYVKPYLDIGDFNGTILVAKTGKILLSKGYGMANYELSVPFHSGN